jgi:putative iron-regulated protein
MTRLSAWIAIAAASPCLLATPGPGARADQPVDPAAVLDTYADIAEAGYEDAWLTARQLQAAVDAFLAAPGAATQ